MRPSVRLVVLSVVSDEGFGVEDNSFLFFISVFYVAPPIKLKYRGLGEPAVFLVWGPLMIGGTYYVTAGQLPPLDVWLSTIPYALVVTTVLIGKHIDKLDADKVKGIHTLPVLLGEHASLWLNMTLMTAYYVLIIALVLTGNLGIWALLVLLAIPRLMKILKIYQEPKPSQSPEGYPEEQKAGNEGGLPFLRHQSIQDRPGLASLT